MAAIRDLKEYKKYKKAKVIVEELDTILKIVGLTIQGLAPYSRYVAVSGLLLLLKETKVILEAQRKKVKVIVKNKGKEK